MALLLGNRSTAQRPTPPDAATARAPAAPSGPANISTVTPTRTVLLSSGAAGADSRETGADQEIPAAVGDS
jgi:hypothetical protein